MCPDSKDDWRIPAGIFAAHSATMRGAVETFNAAQKQARREAMAKGLSRGEARADFPPILIPAVGLGGKREQLALRALPA